LTQNQLGVTDMNESRFGPRKTTTYHYRVFRPWWTLTSKEYVREKGGGGGGGGGLGVCGVPLKLGQKGILSDWHLRALSGWRKGFVAKGIRA